MTDGLFFQAISNILIYPIIAYNKSRLKAEIRA